MCFYFHAIKSSEVNLFLNHNEVLINMKYNFLSIYFRVENKI